MSIVGLGDSFHILEGDAVAPYIAGLGPAVVAPGAAAMEEEEAPPAGEGSNAVGQDMEVA